MKSSINKTHRVPDGHLLSTPVAFFIFNRPTLTETVFEVISQIQPAKLLVVADGPRADKVGEAEKCAEARAIVDRVDWDCDVLKNYSDVNMGCRRRVASGLDWVFDKVEEAIVLEDDCLPHPSFFNFCDEMLNKYRDDKRVMMISGFNFLGKWKSDIQSYHFSYVGGGWGWASWRRAWEYFDVDMKLWAEPEAKARVRDVLCDTEQYLWWEKSFDTTFHGEIDTWDYQWLFARLLYSGLSIVPSVNLISNIGFHEEATHTTNPVSTMANLPSYPLSFPLVEPYGLADDRGYNHMSYVKMIGGLDISTTIIKRILRRVKRLRNS